MSMEERSSLCYFLFRLVWPRNSCGPNRGPNLLDISTPPSLLALPKLFTGNLDPSGKYTRKHVAKFKAGC